MENCLTGKRMSIEELTPIVNGVALKYSRKSNVEKADLAQDLWMHIFEKDPVNAAQARTILMNKAIDICRSSYRKARHQSNVPYATDEETENYLCHSAGYEMVTFAESEDGIDNVTIANILNSLGERERRYLVAKVYLTNGLDCLKDEFNRMVAELSDEDMKTYKDLDVNTNEDLIVKLFCGIRYGRNSGTARKVRENVRATVTAFM